MSVQPNQAIQVFYSYAHEDESLRIQLEKHLSSLRREGVITDWHYRKITAGKEWQNEIDTHLNSSHIILLLISANFIASNYCWDVEVRRAMERYEVQEARVIPIILDFVDWKYTPFAKLQALPKDGRPVRQWNPHARAFENIAQGIREVAKELTDPTYHTKKYFRRVGTGVIPLLKTIINIFVKIAKVTFIYFLKPSKSRRYRRSNKILVRLFIVLSGGIFSLFILQSLNILQIYSSEVSGTPRAETQPILSSTQIRNSTGWIRIGKINNTSNILSAEELLIEASIDPPVIPLPQSVVTMKYEINLWKEKYSSSQVLQKLKPGEKVIIFNVEFIPKSSQDSSSQVWAQVRKM